MLQCVVQPRGNKNTVSPQWKVPSGTGRRCARAGKEDGIQLHPHPALNILRGKPQGEPGSTKESSSGYAYLWGVRQPHQISSLPFGPAPFFS